MNPRKLTAEQALKVRELYATGKYTYKGLSEMFGASVTIIHRLCQGYSYMSLTGGEPIIFDGHRSFSKCGHRGESHPAHKLTEEQVIEIRKLWISDGKLSLHQIGERYGVHESTISAIVNNRIWKDLPSADELRKGKSDG